MAVSYTYTFWGGLSGVGKTTTILCLSRILLGASWKDAVLELNASNERGIDVVRNRIKMFAQQKVSIDICDTKYPFRLVCPSLIFPQIQLSPHMCP